MAKPVTKIVTIAAVVIVGSGLYVWGNHYAKEEANIKAKALIGKIQSYNSNIQNITYSSIDVGLLSFFTHNFSINQVKMSLYGQPIKIKEIIVDNFSLMNNQQLDHIDITFDHIQLDKDRDGLAKSYLDMIQTRKAQLKELIDSQAQEGSSEDQTNEDIKAYVGWFNLLEAVTSKYIESYGSFTFKYDREDQKLSTNFDVNTQDNDRLIHIESDLNDVVFNKEGTYATFLKAHPGAFSVQFNLDHLFKTDSKESNEALKEYLMDVDPSLDFTLDYVPNKKSMDLKLKIDNSYTLDQSNTSKQHYTGNVSLKDVDLSQYSLGDIIDQTTPLAGFANAYIDSSDANVDAKFEFPKEFIMQQAENIGIKAIVEQLPYKTYDLYLKGDGSYNQDDGKDYAKMSFGLEDKLDFNLEAQAKVIDKLKVSDYIEMLKEALKEQQSTQDQAGEEDTLESLKETLAQAKVINEKIQLLNWQLTLANHDDFLENMTKIASTVLETPEPQIKGMLKSIMHSVIDSNDNLLEVASYQKALDKFIDHPDQLTLSINPKPPVSIATFYQTFIDYLTLQQQQAQAQQEANTGTGAHLVTQKSNIDVKALKQKLDQLNIKLTAD